MVYMCSICGHRRRTFRSKCKGCGKVPYVIFSTEKGFGNVSLKRILSSELKGVYDELMESRKNRVGGILFQREVLICKDLLMKL
jgi:hypothetical protein